MTNESTHKPLIKLCGFATPETVDAAIKAEADMVGFVFYPSSARHVSIEQASMLMAKLPDHIASVAVTVNADDAFFEQLCMNTSVKALQLHGKESPERAAMLKERYGLSIIKALPVYNHDDVALAAQFEEVADMLLFDAKATTSDLLPGGNGICFDWSLLQAYKGNLPMLVSGGLTAENAVEALTISGAQGVDVSSGIESLPGEKNCRLIHDFTTAIRTGMGY